MDFFVCLLLNICIEHSSALNIFPNRVVKYVSVAFYHGDLPSHTNSGCCENSYLALFVTFYVFLFSPWLVTFLSILQYTER